MREDSKRSAYVPNWQRPAQRWGGSRRLRSRRRPFRWRLQARSRVAIVDAALPDKRLCRSSACPGRDVVGLAQTGSGKTGAFALPILQVCRVWYARQALASPRLTCFHTAAAEQALLNKPQPFFALVLSPTRELAVQISSQARVPRRQTLRLTGAPDAS